MWYSYAHALLVALCSVAPGILKNWSKQTYDHPYSVGVLVCFFFGTKSALNVGVSFMVCEELGQLEWDFIQTRAQSTDIDSLGWTDREFACLDARVVAFRAGKFKWGGDA
jgi:hypothetical protein